eukprot:485073-Rhodomonas_salina.1
MALRSKGSGAMTWSAQRICRINTISARGTCPGPYARDTPSPGSSASPSLSPRSSRPPPPTRWGTSGPRSGRPPFCADTAAIYGGGGRIYRHNAGIYGRSAGIYGGGGDGDGGGAATTWT